MIRNYHYSIKLFCFGNFIPTGNSHLWINFCNFKKLDRSNLHRKVYFKCINNLFCQNWFRDFYVSLKPSNKDHVLIIVSLYEEKIRNLRNLL